VAARAYSTEKMHGLLQKEAFKIYRLVMGASKRESGNRLDFAVNKLPNKLPIPSKNYPYR
jgi:hypothetical protein